MRISDWSSDVCSSDLSVVAELAPEQQDFIVTFTVEEGPRYKFGKIGLQTGLRNLDPEALREHVTTEEGDWYDASEVDETIEALTDAVGDLGYAFVDIRPRVQRDRDNLTRSEEHTSELQSLMRISYAVFCLKKKKNTQQTQNTY